MTVAIVTDSTCDLPISTEAIRQIDIIPLTVTFGDKTYRDGIDLTNKEFYSRLAKAEILPTTSQPAPAAFQACFRWRLDEGKDVLGLFLSSELSGTYQSALLARSSFTPEEQSRIFLIDSRQVTASLTILLLHACRLRDQGATAAEIAAALTLLTQRARLCAVLDTMKYLKMGGRVSAATAAAGGILNIAPVLGMVGGKLVAIDKIRKRPQIFHKWLREKLLSDLPDPVYGGAVMHSNAPQLAQELKEQCKYLFPADQLPILSMGAVIGTHAGPNAVGLAYIAKAKN